MTAARNVAFEGSYLRPPPELSSHRRQLIHPRSHSFPGGSLLLMTGVQRPDYQVPTGTALTASPFQNSPGGPSVWSAEDSNVTASSLNFFLYSDPLPSLPSKCWSHEHTCKAASLSLFLKEPNPRHYWRKGNLTCRQAIKQRLDIVCFGKIDKLSWLRWRWCVGTMKSMVNQILNATLVWNSSHN